MGWQSMATWHQCGAAGQVVATRYHSSMIFPMCLLLSINS